MYVGISGTSKVMKTGSVQVFRHRYKGPLAGTERSESEEMMSGMRLFKKNPNVYV